MNTTFFDNEQIENIHGAIGEKEKIYQSVVSEFDKKVNEYSSYIENNKDYAGVNDTKDEWLKNNSSFMASELRNVWESTATKTKSTNDVYRYKGNQFANFYDVQDKQMSLGSLTSTTYRKETSDLESMINSFNSFVNKFELGQNNLMQLSEFSAYA